MSNIIYGKLKWSEALEGITFFQIQFSFTLGIWDWIFLIHIDLLKYTLILVGKKKDCFLINCQVCSLHWVMKRWIQFCVSWKIPGIIALNAMFYCNHSTSPTLHYFLALAFLCKCVVLLCYYFLCKFPQIICRRA